MHFVKTELNITDYLQHLRDMLGDVECHVFIDTNILSQLYKLNDKGRVEFLSWADSMSERIHIPNWVVMEYNLKMMKGHQTDYLDELGTIKTIKKQLDKMQAFLKAYADNDILQGTVYQQEKNRVNDDMDVVLDEYDRISKAVTKNVKLRLKTVEEEIRQRLDKFVVDTDIYSIMLRADQQAAIRFQNQVPPGLGDEAKSTNNIGDLIIWLEILDCCKRHNWKKAIYISRDCKGQYYQPIRQQRDGFPLGKNDVNMDIAHESLVYEFSIATDGGEICLINYYTLNELIGDQYPELAFSFQTVSREAEDDIDDDIKDSEDVKNTELMKPELGNSIETPKVIVEDEKVAYSQIALEDKDYLMYCHDNDLLLCIERLKSYNWYKQNDAIDDLRKILNSKKWEETQDNKDAFFVIGRNILQSADGNAFGAYTFIKDMHDILKKQAHFIKRAFVDGCLYEVFFDSHGKIRKDGFKARYKDEVMKQAKMMKLELPFNFINCQLEKVKEKFVPVIDDSKKYEFQFTFSEPQGEFDHYHTVKLTINGKDESTSFMRPIESIFSGRDEITRKLSENFGIPEKDIEPVDIPESISVVFYIKENGKDDIDPFGLQ